VTSWLKLDMPQNSLHWQWGCVRVQNRFLSSALTRCRMGVRGVLQFVGMGGRAGWRRGKVMKRYIFAVAIFMWSVSAVHGQEVSQPIFFIPGMPVPQFPAAQAPSATEGRGEAQAQNRGRIGRVTRRGEMSSGSLVQTYVTLPGIMATYRGVTPPERLQPENAATFSRAGGNQVSWIGFMPQAEGHRVFIQTSQQTPYEQLATAGNRVELILRGARLSVSNNQRVLEMQYFQTPFLRARAVPSGKDVRIIVEFKEAVPYEVRQTGDMIDIIVRTRTDVASDQ